MIKLKNPLNYKGLLHEAGTVLSIPPELEDKLVKTGSAERYVAREKEEPAKEPPQASETDQEPEPDKELQAPKKGGK